jgi:hypothetical protein
MSGIDGALLPYMRRKIYCGGFAAAKRRTVRAFDTGYETDIEGNRPHIRDSPTRPYPTSITFGSYNVTRKGEDDLVLQHQSNKRKRHSNACYHNNNYADYENENDIAPARDRNADTGTASDAGM